MTEQLKPCPFCGGAADIRMIGNEYTKKRKVEVYCKTIGCSCKQVVGAIIHSHEWCKEKAIAAWNRRHND